MLFLFISSWSLLIKCAKGGRNKYDFSTSSLQCCATKISKDGQLKKTEVKPITRKLKRNYRNTKQCLLPPRDWAPVIKSSTPDFTPKISYKFVHWSNTQNISYCCNFLWIKLPEENTKTGLGTVLLYRIFAYE